MFICVDKCGFLKSIVIIFSYPLSLNILEVLENISPLGSVIIKLSFSLAVANIIHSESTTVADLPDPVLPINNQ